VETDIRKTFARVRRERANAAVVVNRKPGAMPHHEGAGRLTAAARARVHCAMRLEAMVSLWWLVSAFFFGSYVGAMLIGLMYIARNEDDDASQQPWTGGAPVASDGRARHTSIAQTGL
jgi:hypothetical protein